MTLTEKELRTDRGTVHYWLGGPADGGRGTLVFLYGLTADHRLFDQQTAAFSPEYRVLVWDAPAHGKSRPYADFTYPNTAADLENILLENGIGQAVLIGQSMGWFIAQALLCRSPHPVKALIGIDTCPYGDHYYSRSDQW